MIAFLEFSRDWPYPASQRLAKIEHHHAQKSLWCFWQAQRTSLEDCPRQLMLDCSVSRKHIEGWGYPFIKIFRILFGLVVVPVAPAAALAGAEAAAGGLAVAVRVAAGIVAGGGGRGGLVVVVVVVAAVVLTQWQPRSQQTGMAGKTIIIAAWQRHSVC